MRVVCVSAGMTAPKKGSETYRRKQKYLNYGLLSLASMVEERSLVFHGGFEDPEVFLEGLSGHLSDCRSVLLSIPSFYALHWAIDFSHALSRKHPGIVQHIGGRWVVDFNSGYLRDKFPENAHLHEGLGEERLQMILPDGIGCAEGTRMSSLDYSRLQDVSGFNPSIEVSRGCGMGCRFCQEAGVPLSKLKDPADIIRECERTANVYGYNPNFYFEASFFAPGQRWIDRMAEERSQSPLQIGWRTETRADAIPAKRLQSLYDAGLRYLDIGLESADSRQLRAMQKTNNPGLYLDRAAELLEAATKVGVKCKVNILLYPGESSESIENTISWLNPIKDFIYGISAYPVLLFGLGEARKSLRAQYLSQGAVGFQDIGFEGIEGVDISPQMTHVVAQEEALALSRKFMTKREYFDLKSYSYFEPDYTFDAFCEDLGGIPEADLPFRPN